MPVCATVQAPKRKFHEQSFSSVNFANLEDGLREESL